MWCEVIENSTRTHTKERQFGLIFLKQNGRVNDLGKYGTMACVHNAYFYNSVLF